ncbi:MAG TPA: HlyD family secretion protein, partial [Duganella sp.]|nr:HlyD family secretion protein [Duganella sp.]
IVPAGSPLQAQLSVPSRAIGFIRPDQVVQLRYQAYPYQKFGHARGVVRSVTRSTLATDATAGREASYRVVVTLAEQNIRAYGQPQALQTGMLLEADILHEQRHLYEWVLDPLYSLTGRM